MQNMQRVVVVFFKPLNTCVTWFQGESELVARDDNLDAADPDKDKKTEDKDQQMDTEEKEKINEQGDQVTFIPPELFSFEAVLLVELHMSHHILIQSILFCCKMHLDVTHFDVTVEF